MADTDVPSGAPEAIRSWGGYRPMKGKKRPSGMFGRAGGTMMESKAEERQEERKERRAKKKKSGGVRRGGY